MKLWHHRKTIEDTQPLPKINAETLEAYQALANANKTHDEAVRLNHRIKLTSDELERRCRDNHLALGWLQIMRDAQ